MNLTRVGWAWLVALALLLPGASGVAQSIRGRTVEAESGRGISAVRLVLLSAGGQTISESLSGEDGGFHLVAVNAGDYRIQATHLAYETVTTDPFRLEGGEEIVVDLTLSSTVIALEPLTITARRMDPRQGSTIEGFYARQKMFTQGLGFGRLVTRVDPEFFSSSNARDVLRWLEPPNRGGILTDSSCLVVYWDGRLVLSPDVADQWLDTPASFFEGIEFYRNPSDAPAAFREIPIYLADRVFCSVAALWPRTGYFGEPPPDLTPPQERVNAALALYGLSGELAPGVGVGIEAAGHVMAFRGVALGLLLRRTSHNVAGETLDEVFQKLEQVPFTLPAGRRPFVMWVVGAEGRVTFREESRVRPNLALRGFAARRSFTMVSNAFGTPEVTVASLGLGAGATAGLEYLVTPNIATHVALTYERIAFEAYEELERAWYTSAGSWNGLGLRIGIGYALGR